MAATPSSGTVWQSRYFSINPVDTRIWELLENPISFDKLVASLIGEHDVPVEICRQ